MRTNKKVFIISYVILFLLSWAKISYAEQPTSLPVFNLPTLNSAHLTNKTLLGEVSLLHVWGTWCHYCRDENAMLMKIKKSYGVPIYGISLKDTMSNVREYLNANGNPFVLDGFDGDGSVANNLGIYGTPQTFVVDKKGMIRYSYSGGIDDSAWQDTFLPLIQKLKNER